jgi:(2Fe-2S) ferredoxin
MPAFTHHLFICCNQRSGGHPRGCCDPDGSGKLREEFKACLKHHNVAGLVRANKSGCLDQCELGPIVVIYPQAIWYGGVTKDDVERIVVKTIMNGEVLQDLLIPAEKLNSRPSRKTEQ